MMLFIITFSNIPVAFSTSVHSGSSTLGPYDEARFYLEAEAGEQVQLTYDVNLYPVECALYVLHNYDAGVSPSLIDLNLLSRIYHHTGMSDETEFTPTESSFFLLVALNTVNVTQFFEYEWARTAPDEDLIFIASTSTILLIWTLVFGFCLLLLRKRHRQLIRNEHAQTDLSLNVILYSKENSLA